MTGPGYIASQQAPGPSFQCWKDQALKTEPMYQQPVKAPRQSVHRSTEKGEPEREGTAQDCKIVHRHKVGPVCKGVSKNSAQERNRQSGAEDLATIHTYNTHLVDNISEDVEYSKPSSSGAVAARLKFHAASSVLPPTLASDNIYRAQIGSSEGERRYDIERIVERIVGLEEGVLESGKERRVARITQCSTVELNRQDRGSDDVDGLSLEPPHGRSQTVNRPPNTQQTPQMCSRSSAE
ncbi:hypothetical protein B0H11DRAFT_1926659 [Mycena galericulata]|nr:hypothetical protein B0H11DRAFT_1926659 [Mycena galericulata]